MPHVWECYRTMFPPPERIRRTRGADVGLVQIVRECKVVLFETNFKAELQQDFVQGMDERFDLFKVMENKCGGCVLMARIEKEESAEEIVMDTMQIFENLVAL